MKIQSAVFIKGIRGSDRITDDGTPQIAFVGRSNVGKSSLINALTNKKALVKVSNKPGKTTEINYFAINNKFYFVDLPGYGYAKVSPQEKEKLQKLIVWFLTSPEVSPFKVVLVIDVKVGLTDFDRQMMEILVEQKHAFIIAANKIDKLSQKEKHLKLAAIKEEAYFGEVVSTSTVEKGGIDALQRKMFEGFEKN